MATTGDFKSWLDHVLTMEGHMKMTSHLVKKMKVFGLFDDEMQRIAPAVEVEADACSSSFGSMDYVRMLSRSVPELKKEATAKKM